MTKRLFLLRHAKSSWANATLEDHDRPLQKKGLRRAAGLARWLEERGLGCDLVLCSTALRARETLEVVLPALGKPELRYERAIYEAEPEDLIAMLRKLPEATRSAMIVGHDPTLHMLAVGLSMTARGDALDRLKRKFPTAGLAIVSFGDAGWGSVGPRVGHLDCFFVAPDDNVA